MLSFLQQETQTLVKKCVERSISFDVSIFFSYHWMSENKF